MTRTIRITRLREARLAAGVSQRELAERMGWGQSWLSKVETRPIGKVKLGQLRKYAEAIGYKFCIDVESINAEANT